MSASGGGGGVGVGSGGSSMDRAESSAGSGTGGGGVGVGGGGELAPWPTGADGYKLDRIIGNGAFATVWKAFCPARGVHVAVKVMDLENVTHSFEDIRQEVRTFRSACTLCTYVSGVKLGICTYVGSDKRGAYYY